MLSSLTRAGFTAALIAGLAAGPVLASEGVAQLQDSARRGGEYLVTRQSPTGSFFASEVNSGSSGGAAEVVASLIVAGVHGAAVTSALDYLASRGPQDASRGAYAGRIVLGLIAAGENPRAFRGFDYVDRLQSFYNSTSGSYDQGIYSNALAALAVSASGLPLPHQALRYITANQCPTGGFSHQEGCLEPRGADVDTTALVINLLALDVEAARSNIDRAKSFLLSARNSSGGYGLYAGEPTNANSTGLALSAIAALGEKPRGTGWAIEPGKDPLSQLLALQEASGAFQAVAGASDRRKDYATVQAIPGVLGQSYPIHYTSIGDTSGGTKTTATVSGSESSKPQPTSPKTSPPIEPGLSALPVSSGAAVVVEAPGLKRSFCITVPGTAISGIDALEQIPLPITTMDFGGGLGKAVCRIGRWGNQANCPGSRAHWHYWQLTSGVWTESSTGPTLTLLSPGNAHGWVWTSGPVNHPPSISSPIETCETTTATLGQDNSSSRQTPRGEGRVIALLATIGCLGTIGARRIWKGGVSEAV